jgi:hypothetical protein
MIGEEFRVRLQEGMGAKVLEGVEFRRLGGCRVGTHEGCSCICFGCGKAIGWPRCAQKRRRGIGAAGIEPPRELRQGAGCFGFNDPEKRPPTGEEMVQISLIQRRRK